MSKAKEIWENLSAINVNKHTEQKNNFTYLSWTWAWATLQEEYPDSSYEFREDKVINGTYEVWVDLTVEGITRSMWLAVTDFRNKPVLNPTCDLVANARMRCLVKAIAMFGLGHYIYAGESLPMQVQEVETVAEPDSNIIAAFEDCASAGELQLLWNGLDNKKLYSQAKDAAKARLGL